MTAPLDIRDLWIAQRLEQSAQGVANMRAEAERIIANSRKSIQPMLRQTLAECEADYLQGDYEMVGTRQAHEFGE